MRSDLCRRLLSVLTTAIVFVPCLQAWAQPAGAPVRYTTARETGVRRDVSLPGTAESPMVSLVATEVEGLVADLVSREGSAVEKGDVLAKLRRSNLELRLQAAEAQLHEADARLRRAKNAFGRAQDLLGEKLISNDEFDAAMAERDARVGRVDQLRAEIERIRLDLRRCSIRAPLTGVVVSERTAVGEWLNVGDPVLEIVSLDELDIRVEVPEHYFHQIRQGDQAQVVFDVRQGEALLGKIHAIIPQADALARTFPIKVRIANAERTISAGMLARVSLPVGTEYDAVIVPKDAVVSQGGGQFVCVLDDEDKVAHVPVTTGDGTGAWVVIEGSVEAGQRVVTRGNERLRPGDVVAGEPLEYELP